jgi:hypothetical protein
MKEKQKDGMRLILPNSSGNSSASDKRAATVEKVGAGGASMLVEG